MLERTQVFVDTSYLLASFYNSWETGARAQLEIDLPEVVGVLGRMIEQQLKQPVQRQMWYDGIPDSGPHRYQRALRTCDGVQLRAGQLIEWGERRTQKAVDTRLVADMVLAGVRGYCSDLVLVSGDADMIPGVQEATNAGLRVHLYGFGWDSMSSQLRHCCDSTTILDPREDFADCMQLQVLEGPIPPVVRVKPIGDAEPLDESGPTPVPASSLGRQFTSPRPGEPAENAEERDCEQANSQDSGAPGDDAAFPVPQSGDTSAQGGVGTREPHSIPTPNVLAQQANTAADDASSAVEKELDSESQSKTPNPSMMAPRRKLRSRYVPLPNEVWASAGFQTPFDVGQQYASWWFENAASSDQRDQAHLLSGGGLPPEIDRPLLQFACETLHEYTLTETQRVSLRDGFHSGIRGVLINLRLE
ncbi:NYN domain-containing protein [Corynebacterium pacaense]|uniref:NYN domain-containing protein n=1 Tax=Corynebacterium pacaense TaxID=1816684 RepID=UPI0009B9DD12|nr:NYN domain-containing protein [Corynebacterium pacaense]